MCVTGRLSRDGGYAARDVDAMRGIVGEYEPSHRSALEHRTGNGPVKTLDEFRRRFERSGSTTLGTDPTSRRPRRTLTEAEIAAIQCWMREARTRWRRRNAALAATTTTTPNDRPITALMEVANDAGPEPTSR